jgi:hypothetical protein
MPRKENFLYYEHHTKHQVNRACDETQLFIVTAAYAAVTWPCFKELIHTLKILLQYLN